MGAFVIGGPNVQGERLEFGPYAPDAGHTRIMRSSTGGFIPAQSTHIRESEVCATCHTLITKPLGPEGKEIGEFPEQVPYQEWQHSAYSKQRSCQSCHMPAGSGRCRDHQRAGRAAIGGFPPHIRGRQLFHERNSQSQPHRVEAWRRSPMNSRHPRRKRRITCNRKRRASQSENWKCATGGWKRK